MRLSIVTTVYFAESYLHELHQRMLAVVGKHGWDYEFIFVNDGSTDRSLEVLLSIQRSDPNVTIIDLSRNFGQHPAIVTGLAHATGDLVFYLESDLEEAPEWLDDYIKAMNSEKADVVFGVQKQRRRGAIKDIPGQCFYWALAHIFRINSLRNIVGARLMTRAYVDAILQYKQTVLALSAICHDVGFTQAVVLVDKGYKGSSSYNWRRKVAHAMEYITCASRRPLLWASYGAFLLAMALVPLGMLAALMGLHTGSLSAMQAVWVVCVAMIVAFIAGLQGIIGLYLYKTVSEVSARPLTIIRNIYKAGKA